MKIFWKFRIFAEIFFSMILPTPKEQVILGIDPGTNIMGYGILRVVGMRSAELVTMGVLDLRKEKDPYNKLHQIFLFTLDLVDKYHPNELSIESQFFGKNVQSMLKLGRAQGVAISAALYRNLVINEYAPLKIKMAITGRGSATKDQVADMLRRFLHISEEDMQQKRDATDAVGAAYCHFLQLGRPQAEKSCKSWKEFIAKNPEKVK